MFEGACLDPDVCAAAEAEAMSTLGCNGDAPGSQPANELGGTCTPDSEGGQGSCTEADLYCDDPDENGTGQCITDCISTGGAYVSEGFCPDGFRCFDVKLDTFGYCYADCSAPGDCASGMCDPDGACSS
jgi:hypothetical protein